MITFKSVLNLTSGIQKAERLAPEVEEGNREYKFKLTDLSDDQLTHRITQLNWRLNEGNDEAFYLIGVEDDGNQLGLSEADLQESLRNLQFIADQVGCEMTVRQLFAGKQGTTAEVHMRRKQRITVNVVQVNVAVAGDLNSGKSTMIGVLSTGRLDNGKGLARMQVLTHNHEVESGTTSCISHHSLHFSKDGEVLNADPLPGMGKGNRLRTLSDMELADETSRSVTLIDLAGHSKYLKTTLHGLIGRRPDHCIVCVSATTGLNTITAEHLGVCMYLSVPLVIVITKEDCLGHSTITARTKTKVRHTKNSYATEGSTTAATSTTTDVSTEPVGVATTGRPEAILRLVASIQAVLSTSQRQSRLVSTDAELVEHLQADAHTAATIVPIFTVSNVTGSGLQLLRSYLFQLPAHAKLRSCAQDQATCVRILGSIGNIDEREEVVFPRDEDVFSFRKPVRTRLSTNRYALPGNSHRIQYRVGGPNNNNNHKENSFGSSLMTSSSSDTDIVAKLDAHLEQPEHLRRPYSSPDLPSAATTLQEKQEEGEEDGKAESDSSNSSSGSGEKAGVANPPSPDLNRTACSFLSAREFSEYVESSSSNSSLVAEGGCASTGNRDSLQQQQQQQQSRTKVLIGSIEAGKLSVGEALLLGPTAAGDFRAVTVSSLRLNNVPVCCATAGQTVTLKLTERASADSSKVVVVDGATPLQGGAVGGGGQKRSSATGLVLVSADRSSSVRSSSSSVGVALAHWEFEAEVLVLNHPSKIRANYEPVVHVGCVKQSAKLISIRKLPPTGGAGAMNSNTTMKDKEDDAYIIPSDELSNGDRGLCRFRFLYYPEYIMSGEAMIIREQRTRGVGTITKLL